MTKPETNMNVVRLIGVAILLAIVGIFAMNPPTTHTIRYSGHHLDVTPAIHRQYMQCKAEHEGVKNSSCWRQAGDAQRECNVGNVLACWQW